MTRRTGPCLAWSVLVILFAGFVLCSISSAQVISSKDGGREVTILVTANRDNEHMRAAAAKLQPGGFSVREDDRSQKIVSVKGASEAPAIISILIQDNLTWGVANEIEGIRRLIVGLPDGSRIMVAYVTARNLAVAQEFTADRMKAADALGLVTQATAPYNPYVEVMEALHRYDSQPAGRRLMLLISDGRGLASLKREAQRLGVAVYGVYSPSVGLARGFDHSNAVADLGRGSLLHISGDTGGEAFLSGNQLTSDAYFKELKGLSNGSGS